MRRQQFRRGQNTLINCIVCGKKTHSTIDGMSGTDLCRSCREECEAENEHNDDHDEFVEGCKWCAQEREAGIK
jgi:hypothetical protein